MLHVCLSGALYRPVEDSFPKKQNQKEILSFSSRVDYKDNLGHLSSSEDHLSRRCLEDLFLDEALHDKNRNSLNTDGKFGKLDKFRKQTDPTRFDHPVVDHKVWWRLFVPAFRNSPILL